MRRTVPGLSRCWVTERSRGSDRIACQALCISHVGGNRPGSCGRASLAQLRANLGHARTASSRAGRRERRQTERLASGYRASQPARRSRCGAPLGCGLLGEGAARRRCEQPPWSRRPRRGVGEQRRDEVGDCRVELGRRDDQLGEPERQRPPPRPPSGRSGRARSPAASPRCSTSGFVPVRSGTSPSAGSSCRAWRPRRRSAGRRRGRAGTRRRSRAPARPRWTTIAGRAARERLLVAVDRCIELGVERSQADGDARRARPRREHAHVEPGPEGRALAAHDDDPDVAGQLRADLGQRRATARASARCGARAGPA